MTPQVKAVFRNYHRTREHLVRLTRYLTAPRKAGGPLNAGGLARSSFHRRDALVSTSPPLDLDLDGRDDALGVPLHTAGAQHHQQQQPQQHSAMPGDLTRPAADDENVFWIPLGFGESFVASQAMQSELMSRPLLWSWTGSWGAKPERTQMVKVFQKQPELLKHGVLHT